MTEEGYANNLKKKERREPHRGKFESSGKRKPAKCQKKRAQPCREGAKTKLGITTAFTSGEEKKNGN